MAETPPNVQGNDKEPVVIAAVEGGGTTFVVAVVELPSSIIQSTSSSMVHPKILFRTEVESSHGRPHQTLGECAAFLRQHKPKDGYHALGVASFGPVGLDPQEVASYGRILPTTPKEFWRNVDFLTPLVEACRGRRHLAVKIDTDVNAPAFAEYLLEKDNRSGTSTSGPISSLAYVTVGTGVGVGLVINGKPVHGRMHPEGGHVPIQPLKGDMFTGYSWGAKTPFHGVLTVEGMASSVALTERMEHMTNSKMDSRDCLIELKDDHEIWDHAANAVANLCVTLILTTSVEKIVLGGGVMERRSLLEKVRMQTVVLLNGYLDLPDDMSELITKSSYGSDAGIVGAIVLAQRALEISAQEEEETKNILASKAVVEAKRTAYGVGLSHGIVLAMALVYIGFVSATRTKARR